MFNFFVLVELFIRIIGMNCVGRSCIQTIVLSTFCHKISMRVAKSFQFSFSFNLNFLMYSYTKT